MRRSPSATTTTSAANGARRTAEDILQHFTDHGPRGLRNRALRRIRYRGGARRRPRRQGGLGPHQRGRAFADPEPHRLLDGTESGQARAGRNLGKMASRSAKPPPPTYRWRSTTSVISPARSADRKRLLSEIYDDTVADHFHEPLGVVGQIIPWNFPILMACSEVGTGAGGRQLCRRSPPSRPRHRLWSLDRLDR